MVASFEFATAARIVFGAGRSSELAGILRAFGSRVCLVTGRNSDRVASIISALRSAGLSLAHVSIHREPSTAAVEEGAALARASRCDVLLAIGGGSAMDAGKAIAALATNPGSVFDYLEVIGKARPLATSALPIVAVPTTAGTGAEVTRNAVLQSAEHRVKASLRSPHLLPRVALVDPELTIGLPPSLTATTGLDALTQLIEPFVCRRANPLTDALCREGMARAARSLRRVFERGDDLEARADMALASLFGGLALANAGLGAVHGFAAPISGMYPIAHGAVCAALLPHIMEVNRQAASEQSLGETCRRYDEVARVLTGNPAAEAPDGVRWVEALCRDLAIPRLSEMGLRKSDIPALVEKASVASSMKANPVELTPAQLEQALARAH